MGFRFICDFARFLWNLAQQFSHEYIREHKSCEHDFVNEYIHAQSATL